MHLDGHLPEEEIERRVSRVSRLVDELMLERAAERVGEEVELLVEERGLARAAHQGPDDAATIVDDHHAVGEVLRGRVIDVDGVDLVAAVP